MDRYLLRVEAINIYSGVLDTAQLSVVRGSGLLLRQAIRDIAKVSDATPEASDATPEARVATLKTQITEKVQHWRSISQGASIGLFQFQSATSEDAQAVRQALIDFLNRHQHYKLFTFAVALTPWSESQSFSDASERLLASIRCQQQRQPSLAFDPPSRQGKQGEQARAACDWNHQRPANPDNVVKRDPASVVLSDSVHQRFRYGRSAKKAHQTTTPLARFYQDETDYHDKTDRSDAIARLLDTVTFAEDFHDIAHDPSRKSLSDKLAVFYADGNRFSRIVRGLTSVQELHAFDADLRAKRKRLLTELLLWANATPGMRFGSHGLRFEVLLWGGDELMVVVPAWCGAAVLARFFELTADWQPKIPPTLAAQLQTDDKPALTADGCMTHAVGLVFCHAKTPIARIRALANDLADRAKDALGASVANVYEVAALESIDYPAESLDDYYCNRFGVTASKTWQPRRAVSSEALRQLREKLAELPRRQVYELAHQIAAESPNDIKSRKDRLKQLLGGESESIARILHDALGPWDATAATETSFDTLDNWLWLHLRELWDYLEVDPAKSPTDRDSTRRSDTEAAA